MALYSAVLLDSDLPVNPSHFRLTSIMATKSARFGTLRFIVELCFDGCKNANQQ